MEAPLLEEEEAKALVMNATADRENSDIDEYSQTMAMMPLAIPTTPVAMKATMKMQEAGTPCLRCSRHRISDHSQRSNAPSAMGHRFETLSCFSQRCQRMID